ncbi:GGDEF domain-containing protein [Vibrio sp. HA2012]|uniref:bifunctional diguanylate cyclase/phosphodiesterase n=1 Tax=Vibrio sp. HA2012 TaxID=1971595 RepID=UPI000C2BFF88|nr:EAL domain-containing protein [Vibrio sp. HA2012]PJC87452.1 GGDEF domain-containing protein [Vibrio sp. HA2012]
MKYTMMFRSISVKLLFTLMGISLFTGLLTSSILTAHEMKAAERSDREKIILMANILLPSLTAAVLFDDEQTAQELINPLKNNGNILRVQVTDTQDSIIAQVENEHTVRSPNSEISVLKLPLMIENKFYGYLGIESDDSEIQKRISFYEDFLLIILGIVFVVSFSLAFILRSYFIHPILYLASVADKVTRTRDYSLRARQLSNDEVGALSVNFNSMLEKMESREQDLETRVQLRTTELKIANEKLHQQAYLDSLSGLPNRRFMQEKLQSLLSEQPVRERLPFALMFIDLDGFKEVNDTMGHDYGDILLIRAGERIKQAVRDKDMVARMGGDEFNVLLMDVDSHTEVACIAEDIHASLSDCFHLNGEQVFVTCSIGITLYPEHGDTAETLIKFADLAMYEAKNDGRNCYQFFSGRMLEVALEKRRITEDLRHGIQNDEFELYYQPVVDLASSRVIKAEALIRWNHPEKGFIRPSEFIGLAEDSGLIRELGSWVAKSASREVAIMREEIDPDFQVSINVSPSQFKGTGEWLEDWLGYMAELKLDKSAIIVEITENLLMESEDSVRSNLLKLRDEGISIAIDDFGVGYSSLSYLQEMDVDILKIDRSFVDNLDKDSNSMALCRAMIMMAHQLNIAVIAEGIASDEHKAKLIELGCDYGQGYLFERPMPSDLFRDKYGVMRQLWKQA